MQDHRRHQKYRSQKAVAAWEVVKRLCNIFRSDEIHRRVRYHAGRVDGQGGPPTGAGGRI